MLKSLTKEQAIEAVRPDERKAFEYFLEDIEKQNIAVTYKLKDYVNSDRKEVRVYTYDIKVHRFQWSYSIDVD